MHDWATHSECCPYMEGRIMNDSTNHNECCPYMKWIMHDKQPVSFGQPSWINTGD